MRRIFGGLLAGVMLTSSLTIPLATTAHAADLPTGGEITEVVIDSTRYRVHTFRSDGTFTAPPDLQVEYIVVGGGGSGGRAATTGAGGGGGAGGVLSTAGSTVAVSSLGGGGTVSVTVGSGGTAATSDGQVGSDGGSSALGAVVATGGGGGGSTGAGRPGGSGGGGGGWDTQQNRGGDGTSGQGNAGGKGNARPANQSAQRAGGGGGGATAAGGAASNNVAGTGGAGIAFRFTSAEGATYAVGGNGAVPTTGTGADGPAGSGNGGGGAGNSSTSGAGGTGIVIVRYWISAVELAIVTEPVGGTNGAQLATQPVIEARNQFGQRFTDFTGNVTVDIDTGGGGTLGGTTTIAAVGGVATFTDLTLSGVVGTNYTLQFTSPPLSSVLSQTITVSEGVPTALDMVQQPSGTAVSGEVFAVQPIVRLVDANDNPVASAGVSVTVALASGGGTLAGTKTISTGEDGRAVFTNLSITGTPGDRTLRFTSSGLTAVVSNAITITSTAQPYLTITTQPAAEVVSSALLNPQPVIALRDGFGNPVLQAGVSVSAVIASGGGTLSGTTTIATDSSGVATFTNLVVSGNPGIRTLGFSAPDYLAVTSNSITVTSSGAEALKITIQPSTEAINGAALSTQPVIQLIDASGTPVTTQGIVVTASIASGAGALSGTTDITTNADGVAGFTNLVITGSVGEYTLAFNTPDLAGVTSNVINLRAGPAAALVITSQPSATATSGLPFGQQPVLRIVDAAGNPVASADLPVTAAIASGSGTLIGTNPVTTSATGVATFTDLGITAELDDVLTLQFTANGFTSPESTSIRITNIATKSLAMAVQPESNAKAGFVLDPQPQVQLQDAVGNPEARAGIAVTAEIATGPGGTLGGTRTVATNETGRAIFTDLKIEGVIGDYTLRFTADDYAEVFSATIGVACGTCAQMRFDTAPPASAVNGQLLNPAPVVQLVDIFGNPTESVRPITVDVATGPGVVIGTLTVDTVAGTGRATFTDLAIVGSVGPYTLRFTSPEITSLTSNAITLSAGVADRLQITQQPVGGPNGALLAAQPILRLLDSGGNVVDAATTVTATLTGPNAADGTLGGTTSVTSASGIAAFTDLTLTGIVGIDYQLTFTAGGVTPVESDPVRVSPGEPTSLLIAVQPVGGRSGQLLDTQPQVRILDAGGNLTDSTATVTVSLTGPNADTGELGGTVAVAAVSGAAIFTDLTLAGIVGVVYQMQFAVAGLDPVVSNDVSITCGQCAILGLTTQPSLTTSSGQVLLQQPVVRQYDAQGNPTTTVRDISVAIAEVVSAPAGSTVILEGTATLTTVDGFATYTDLRITGPVGAGVILEFTSPGLQSIRSDAVYLAASPAQLLTITPIGAQVAGVPFDVTVTLTDAAGNPVLNSGATGTVTVSLKEGSGVLGGTLTGTIVSGDSSVLITGVTYNRSDPVVVLTATGSGSGSLVDGKLGDSNGFVVTGADRLVIDPIAAQQSGQPFDVTVTLVDVDGTPVVNRGAIGSVALSAVAPSGNIGGSLTGTIPIGASTVTISGVIYTTTTTTSVVLIASGSGTGSLVAGKAGDSGAFLVTGAPSPGPGPAPGPDPEPVPEDVAPPRTLDPVVIALLPGQDRVTVDEVPVAVTVRANDTNDGLVISGPQFGLQLACVGRSAQPVPLGAAGVLQAIRGRVLQVCVIGYRPNSPVRVYLIGNPTPRLLGVLATDSSGYVTGSVEIPADAAVGGQTIQVNGYTPQDRVLRTSVGAQVVDAETITKRIGSRVVFAFRSAALTPQSRRALRALIAQVPEKSGPITIAAGAVRAKGATRAERALATKRAERVARFLRANGLQGTIRVRTKPVAVQNRAQDRRVDVTVRFTTELF